MTIPPTESWRSSSSAGEAMSRGRLLVIGDADFAVELSHATPRPICVVPTVYDAIGELTNTSISEAPDAVVASAEVVGDDAANWADAIRRIDPSVTLLIAVQNASAEKPPTSSEPNGFDAVVNLPANAVDMERAITGFTPPPPAPPPPAEADDLLDSVDSMVEEMPPVVVVPARESESKPERKPKTPSVTPTAEETVAAREAVVPREVVKPTEIGDVDLVRAILQSPDCLPTLALQLIASQTGWNDVAIVDDDPKDARAQATIEDGGKHLGYLVADLPDDECPTLRAWARWLAPWMALARRHDEWKDLAHTDELTGARNRRYFNQHLTRTIEDAKRKRQSLSVLVFDIDDFKQYNDRYGHGAGDDILIETVKLLRSVIRPSDEVCRIGGDEFAVVFFDPSGQREVGSHHPSRIEAIARRFQAQVSQHRFPKLGDEAPGRLTISGGLATYPWDGLDGASLLEHADQNALASKRAGKNTITFGPTE